MTDLTSKINNFFINEKERFVKEVSQYLDQSEELKKLKIKSDIFDKNLELDYLKLHTHNILVNCCETGNFEIVRFLVERGAEIDNNVFL